MLFLVVIFGWWFYVEDMLFVFKLIVYVFCGILIVEVWCVYGMYLFYYCEICVDFIGKLLYEIGVLWCLVLYECNVDVFNYW